MNVQTGKIYETARDIREAIERGEKLVPVSKIARAAHPGGNRRERRMAAAIERRERKKKCAAAAYRGLSPVI